MRYFLFFTLLAPAILSAGPLTDEQLLEKVRQRSTAMDEITKEPQYMPDRVSLLCRPPTQAEMDGAKANPHIKKFSRFYADKAGRAAAEGHEPFHPEGTVLLKEKLPAGKDDKVQPGASPELFTGMLKREKGFNPGGGDWEFFTVSGDAKQLTSRGKTATCMDCHHQYADQDYTSRELVPPRWLKAGEDGSVLLHSKDAWVFGKNMRYEPQPHKNTLGYWTRKEDTAKWTAVVPKGRYEVEILQGCGKGSGGAEVEVKVVSYAGDPVQPLSFTVEDTGHFQNFKARVIGTVEFAKEARAEILIAPKTKPGAAVMDLRQIVLRPVKS